MVEKYPHKTINYIQGTEHIIIPTAFSDREAQYEAGLQVEQQRDVKYLSGEFASLSHSETPITNTEQYEKHILNNFTRIQNSRGHNRMMIGCYKDSLLWDICHDQVKEFYTAPMPHIKNPAILMLTTYYEDDTPEHEELNKITNMQKNIHK